MTRWTPGSGGSGGDSGPSLDELADEFTDGTDIKTLELISSIAGAFVAIWVGVWIEMLSVVVGLQVWVIDGVGRFAERVVLELFGVAAATQAAAWREGFRAGASDPLVLPFILMAEVLLVVVVFAAIRKRGVLP